jgi:hypothetical protein
LLPNHTSRDLTRLAAKKDQAIRLSPDQLLESATPSTQHITILLTSARACITCRSPEYFTLINRR